MTNDIYAITTYFNPCRYKTKKANFELFASRLQSVGVALIVVEMAFANDEFELRGDYEFIRLRSNSVLWQKERLLNIAISKLPSSCTKVVWLDCDLLFEDEKWLCNTDAALERYNVVQPYSSCIRLPKGHIAYCGQAQDAERETESFAAVFSRNRSLAHNGVYKEHGHTGFAWAARRELLDACGLYDVCLTGSGDHLMAHAFAGTLNSRCIPAMIGRGNRFAEHFASWSVETHRHCAGKLGYVPGRVLHLWHGSITDRRYYWRNQEFKKFDFDPERDLRCATNGLWEWAEAPESIRLWASQLFESRKEDGVPP